jgi:hypothetical protein
MIIDQMHHEFKLEKNKIDSLASMDFIPVEIDAYLNKGIWLFLKTRYKVNKSNNGFETNQDRITQLSNLHIKSPELQSGLAPTLVSNGVYKIELKDLDYEYLYLTGADVDINTTSCKKTGVKVKLTQTDDLNTLYSSPDFNWSIVNGRFGKADSGTAINDEKSALYLYTEEDSEISNINIDYIKYPNRVFFQGYDHIDGQSSSTDPKINCDIDAAFHDEIVRQAVLLAIEDLGDVKGMQIKNKQVNLDN